MQTVTFPCPNCKNLMAVETDLLGRAVECPTCREVVPAPTDGQPAAAPAYQIIAAPAGDSNFAVYPPGVPQPEPPAPTEATIAIAPERINEAPSSSPTIPGEAPPAAVMAPEHWPAASEPPLPEPPPPQWPSADGPGAAPLAGAGRERRQGGNLLLAILAPYSVVMTLVAGWYFYKAANPAAVDHPLANIPDIFAQYEPATRRQLARRVEGMPPVDAPLPPSLFVHLGGTLRVGDLEVTPEKVEQRPITIHTVLHDNQAGVDRPPGEALVLHLLLRNRSSDVFFHPTDPVFDRLYDRRQGSKPYTQLVAGDYHSYGGAIDVLSTNRRVKRQYVEGQEHDDKPLPPGEARRTVVVTDPQDAKALEAVKNHAGGEPIVWRVQLRRGLTTFRGRELSVCAVVGIQFNPGDVQRKD